MPRCLTAPLVLLLLTTVAAGQESDSNTRFEVAALGKAHGPREARPIAPPQSPRTVEPEIVYPEPDKDVAASLRPYLQQGQQKVERFFGEPFQKPF